MQNNLLLLTGWGATCNVWEPIIPALESRYQIKCVNPPWVKDNELSASLDNLDNYVGILSNSFKGQAVKVIAWSLGGLIAVRLAERYPELIKQIIFIASAPQFIADGNNQYCIDRNWFESFVKDFKDKPQDTLKKFIALQVKDDENAMGTARLLKKYCDVKYFNLDECYLGLKILEIPLLKELQNLKCTTSFIHGEKDSVLSYKAAEFAARQVNSEIQIVKNAGHVPHVSHPENTVPLIEKFFDK